MHEIERLSILLKNLQRKEYYGEVKLKFEKGELKTVRLDQIHLATDLMKMIETNK